MSAEPDLGRLPAGGLPDLLGPGISDLCWSGWDESTAAEPGMQSWDATAAATAAAEAATTHSADPELEKRRAQNRAAMQRHRQRQRQRQAEQQQQCAELASELERARLEHQAALSEHSALEARHGLRDDWMQVLQVLRLPGEQAHQAECAAGAGAAAAAPTPPGPAAEGGDAQAPHAALQLAAWLEELAGSSTRPEAASGRWVPLQAASIASSLRASPGLLTSVRALTPAQLLGLWDTLLVQVDELLARVEATACKAAEQQLAGLMIESCMYMDLWALLHPNHFKVLMLERGMPAQPPEGEGVHAHWREVLAAMRLTPAQRAAMLAEWRAFQARQAELASAANAAAAGVAAAAAADPQCAAAGQQPGLPATAAAAAAAAAAGAPAASMADQVERYVALAGRAGQLAAAADAHWASLLAFSDASFYMLSPLQGARMLAACRPYYPDPIQLARALEEAPPEEGGGGEAEAPAAASALACWGQQDGSASGQAACSLLGWTCSE